MSKTVVQNERLLEGPFRATTGEPVMGSWLLVVVLGDSLAARVSDPIPCVPSLFRGLKRDDSTLVEGVVVNPNQESLGDEIAQYPAHRAVGEGNAVFQLQPAEYNCRWEGDAMLGDKFEYQILTFGPWHACSIRDHLCTCSGSHNMAYYTDELSNTGSNVVAQRQRVKCDDFDGVEYGNDWQARTLLYTGCVVPKNSRAGSAAASRRHCVGMTP